MSLSTGTRTRETATEATATRLRSEGWRVVRDPAPTDLPPALAAGHLDLLARRGEENLVVQIRSRTLPPGRDTVSLAEQVAGLPGWRLELVYVPEPDQKDDKSVLLDRATRSRGLAEHDPEAALLLVWSAIEGMLHRLAEQHGADTGDSGGLIAELTSRGLLSDDEHDVLNSARWMRDPLAHGLQGPSIESSVVACLADLAEEIAKGSRTTSGAA